ncbi:HEAT repeat domain-containing protein [Amnibacterium setariae]|uniref:HEAT repeat domain-containing protein n=1 Tax=Amnibacterium setariae TaxID=2306585 RepID=UPI001F450178|nr:HEAT repeat domain-containing protein [Amnibacterium setariae]
MRLGDGARDGDGVNPSELTTALRHESGSTRLRAAMAAGTTPDPDVVDVLVERSGVEPDFFVRDMLTWALTRLPADLTVPRLVAELSSPFPQARSQSLHTLTKLADPRSRPALTPALVHDEEDEVARAAWRLAVVLVPADIAGEPEAVAEDLATELGRRGPEAKRSLTRAMTSLGEAARPVLERIAEQGAFAQRVHAGATLLILDDPRREFMAAMAEARRTAIDVGPTEPDAS